MKYNNIVIGGMGLAGSTLCFNICRFICEELEFSYSTYLGVDKREGKKNKNDKTIHIHKSHYYNNKFKGNDFFNIFVVRDLRDTVSSMKRKTPNKWNGNEIGCADYNMGYYKSWNGKKKDFIFKYENYKSKPFETIKEITKQLGIEFSDDQIKSVHNNAENLKNKDHIPEQQSGAVWNETFLTKKHSTNNGKIGDYRSNLTEEIVSKIEKKYRNFFETHNYEIK